jgi:NADH:ubiquinone oxidoreductase subunit 3 (subunit A)
MDFSLSTYYPVFIYLVVVVGFAVTNVILTQIIGPKRRTPVKLMPYESGMDPIGDARQHFDVKYYLMAVLFLLFDVELLFLYPWAVSAYRRPEGAREPLVPTALSGAVFWEMLIFLATLAVAYVYAWRKGVFRWR